MAKTTMNGRLVLVLVVLTVSLQASLGQDLSGCGTKGCFSRGCPCNDCSASVTWEMVSGRMEFSLRVERPAGVKYVALGLRPSNVTSGMDPADVYACTTGSNQVQRSENIGHNSFKRTAPNNTVTTDSHSSEDNVITCTFTRALSSDDDDDNDKFYNISGDNDYYLILAIGDAVNDDGTIEGHHHYKYWVSPYTVRLASDRIPATQAPVGTPPPMPGLEGCGSTRGCISQYCPDNSCNAFVTWENAAGGDTRFSLRAETSGKLGWVAFGLRPSNTTTKMVPAEVYYCIRGKTVIQRSENTIKEDGIPDSVELDIPNDAIMLESFCSDDKMVTCTFLRQPNATGYDKFYDISGASTYYVLLAVGGSVVNWGRIEGSGHIGAWSSSESYQLQQDFPVATEPPPLVTQVPTVSDSTPDSGLSECGKTIGCFRPEARCGGDCTSYVTYQKLQNGRIRFTLKGQSSGGIAWVAVGLGSSSGMSPADVYACTSKSDKVVWSENEGRDSVTSTLPDGAVETNSIDTQDNEITCTFTRQSSIENNDKFYNLSSGNSYYLLLAVGDKVNADGTIQGHYHVSRWLNTDAVDLMDFSVITVPATPDSGLSECGKTIGCFRPEARCGGDCTSHVTYQKLENGRIRFTLKGQRSGGIAWVAVGLGSSSGMSPADVYACTSGSDKVLWSENEGRDSLTRTLPDGAVETESIETQGNEITCTFTRQSSIENNDKFYNLSSGNSYYLLLGVGDKVNADGTIQGHRHVSKWLTTDAVDLTEFKPIISQAARNVAFAKTHASFMVIAWMGFASVGLIMARYLKPMWPSSKIAGQKVWFMIHRTCMQTCAVFFILGFILIFVYVDGFIDTNNKVAMAHAVCGIIATFLGLFNPIMALFRPHPGTKWRFLFNNSHRAVGITAYLTALTTIFLGIGYKTSLLPGLESNLFYAMIVFVVFDIAIWIGFELHRHMIEKKGSEYALPMEKQASSASDVPLKSTIGTDSADADPESPAGAGAKFALFGIYVSGLAVFIVVFIIFIGIAKE